jgi:ribosomal protein S18 acetylase RimI-like enzyme
VAGDEVVGWAQGHDLDLLQYPRVLEVGGLVVSDQFRGRGVGKMLVDALIAWGRQRGHDEVRVRSSITRAGTPEFYEALGFTRVKTSYTFAQEI